MRNYVQPGDTFTVPAPADTASGDFVQIGSLFGVAAVGALNNADLELATGGVYDLNKVSAQAWAVGAPVYWDPTAKLMTNVAGSLTKVGVALAIAANPSAVGRVRLNRAF